MNTQIERGAIERQIEKLGWNMERAIADERHPLATCSHGFLVDKCLICPTFRASQGGFKTLWRNTPEETLKDVQAIKQARETCKTPF